MHIKKIQQNMNKTNLSFRAMSVSNCPTTTKQIKHLNKSHTPSTLGSEVNVPELDNINQIFKLHFPEIIATQPITSININNYEEVLHRLLKQIKIMQSKAIANIENQYRNIEVQLKLLRDSRDKGQQKIKVLQTEISVLSQKMKGKQFDSYAKNQEIFNLKQKIESMEKTIVMKNIEVKNVYEQLEGFKVQCQNQIEMYSNINSTIKTQNKKLKGEVRKCMVRIAELEAELESSEMQRDKIFNIKPHIIKASYLEPFSDQNRYDSKSMIRNRSCSASNKSQTTYSFYDKPEPTKEELIHEVKELRDNQSALIDRLAQRDKMIENLEHSLSQTLVQ